jgi:hypothetical protein
MSDLSVVGKRPLGGVIWFIWMVAMWLAFFVLLFADQLAELWAKITQLPIVVEIVLWIAFLPWMLGSWVWTGSSPLWLRAGLVFCFAVGWTIISIPRRQRPRAAPLRNT